MAIAGTPNEGRDNIIGPNIYVAGTGLELILYTNTRDSLDQTSVLADLSEPAGTGYAAISLGGTWSYTNGVFAYDHGSPDNPQFENTGGTTWTGGDVTGCAITDGTYLLHFRDLTIGDVTFTPGTILEVNIASLVT